MRAVLLAVALAAATPTLCAAQADDPDPTVTDGGVVNDGGAAQAPAAGGITPDIAATVRGQTSTYTKPLTPQAPVAPQSPRRPIPLSAPGGFATPQGPVGPQGLPR